EPSGRRFRAPCAVRACGAPPFRSAVLVSPPPEAPMFRPSSPYALLLSALFPLTTLPASAQERPWTVEDVLALKSPGSLAISPDGQWVAFVVSQRDLENNRALSD